MSSDMSEDGLEDIDRLLDACRGSHIHPIVVTALHTGMRKAELLNLEWADIDFTQGTVTIQSKKDWHTKNYRSRTVSVTPTLYETLQEHRKHQVELGVRSRHVFTYQGNQIKRGIKDSLKTAVRKAGLENVTLHSLIHTFASQLAMAGVPLRDIQELMGHQSFQTTLQYAHLSEEHAKKQVLRLPFAGEFRKSWAQRAANK